MMDMWDFIRVAKANSAEGLSQGATNKAKDESPAPIEEKFAQLALITRAFFELTQEKLGISEKELARRITEIDLRDGKADGRMEPIPKKCPACGAMMSPKFNRCLFCGCKDKTGDPFNPVK